MAIPIILKGDTAAAIPFTAPDAVVELLAVYQGVTRRFANVASGASLSIAFTAEETAKFELGTFPLVFAAKFADGRVKTYPFTAKVKVTDSPGLVYLAEVVIPGEEPAPLDGVDEIPARHTADDTAAKVNEIIRKLGGGTAATALALCLSAFGAGVQTAPLGTIYNDAPVVTNVTFDGLAPADYATISNRAMLAVQPAEMAAAIAAATNALPAAATDLTPATNYVDAATNAALAAATERFIPISGDNAIITDVSLFFNREIYEQRMLCFMLPDGLNVPAVDFVSSAQITNEGAVVAAAANAAERITAATNAALAAAKYYADTAIAAAIGQDASWNRPGEWTLAFDAIPTTPTIHAVEITTNDLTGVVISNATITESQTLSAHVYPVALDEMSPSSPPSVSLSCDEEGTTIDGSVFTATADGVYTVRGTGTNGVTRAASVAIYSSLTRQRTASAYIADTNAVRRDVNDQAAFITANCTYHEILDYPEVVGPGSFKAWETITPTWAWPGRGRESPWAIAPKVLMTATHYGWYYPTGEVTLWDNVGNTNFTIVISSSEYWPTLFEWAQANGYTAAETAIADMHDLRFGVIEQGHIPDACLPYLVDADELDALFGGSVEGVTAWFYPQGDSLNREDNHYPFCIPVVLGASDYRTERIRWTGPAFFTDRYPAIVREDVRAAVGTYDARNWFRIRPGDSGRPCFIMWGAYDIPISQAHTVDTGPSIPAAAKIIRHFCRAHGCEPKSLPASLFQSNQ